MVSVTITITRTVAELLGVLDDAGGGETQPLEMRVHRVLLQLANHAQQGVYRNGAWERQWLAQAFNVDVWYERLEPGDPYERLHLNPEEDSAASRRFYSRPRKGYYDGVPLAFDDEDRNRPCSEAARGCIGHWNHKGPHGNYRFPSDTVVVCDCGITLSSDVERSDHFAKTGHRDGTTKGV